MAPPQPAEVSGDKASANRTVFEAPSVMAVSLTPVVLGPVVLKIRPAGSVVWNGTTPNTPTPHGPVVLSVAFPYMSPLPVQAREFPRTIPYALLPISLCFRPPSDA